MKYYLLIQTFIIYLSQIPQIQSQEHTADCTLNCLKGICIPSSYTLNGQSFQLDQCQCEDGWGGVLCDEVGKSCPDGTKCYNGAECAERKKMETKGVNQYYCDCQTAYDHSSFAGQMCEAPATQVCEYGVSVSKSAFCTNGGKCKDVVVKDSSGQDVTHPGCKCPDGFVGDHCEYLKGTEPVFAETTITNTQGSSSNEGSEKVQSPSNQAQSAPDSPPPQSKSYVAVKVVAIICMVGVVVAAAIGIRISLKKRKNMKSPKPVINLAAEAGVDDNGKKSKVVMNGETQEEDYEEIDII